MAEDRNPTTVLEYKIIIEGHLSESWVEWFEGLSFEHTCDGTTILTGGIIDQAALHGLLKKIRDLGLTLLSVNRVPAAEDQADASDSEIRIEDAAGQGDSTAKAPVPGADPETNELADNP